MVFLKKYWGLLLFTTAIWIGSELLILLLVSQVMCGLADVCGWGGQNNPNYSPVRYYVALTVGLGLLLAPLVVMFRFLSSIIGRKATTILLSIYLIVGAILLWIGM